MGGDITMTDMRDFRSASEHTVSELPHRAAHRRPDYLTKDSGQRETFESGTL